MGSSYLWFVVLSWLGCCVKCWVFRSSFGGVWVGSDCVLVMFLGGVFIYWFYGLFGGVWLRFLGGHFGRFSGCEPVLASFLSVGKLAMVVVRVQGAPPRRAPSSKPRTLSNDSHQGSHLLCTVQVIGGLIMMVSRRQGGTCHMTLLTRTTTTMSTLITF